MSHADTWTEVLAVLYELERDRRPRDLLPMRDVRHALSRLGHDRETENACLTELSRQSLLVMMPESQDATLTREDDDAAIWLGGAWNYVLQLQLH
uniref:hypothetical protein n=1 Tax=Amycolatopsis sp. CA-096443 TaxID=3239919 RepID=UPI003F49AB1A